MTRLGVMLPYQCDSSLSCPFNQMQSSQCTRPLVICLTVCKSMSGSSALENSTCLSLLITGQHSVVKDLVE
jgi:hypothetical protein